MDPYRGHQSQRNVPRKPDLWPPDDQAATRLDHQYRITDKLYLVQRSRGVRGEQGRRAPFDQVAGLRKWAKHNIRVNGIARRCSTAVEREGAARTRARCCHPGPHADGSNRPRGRACRGRHFPRLRCVVLRHRRDDRGRWRISGEGHLAPRRNAGKRVGSARIQNRGLGPTATAGVLRDRERDCSLAVIARSSICRSLSLSASSVNGFWRNVARSRRADSGA